MPMARWSKAAASSKRFSCRRRSAWLFRSMANCGCSVRLVFSLVSSARIGRPRSSSSICCPSQITWPPKPLETEQNWSKSAKVRQKRCQIRSSEGKPAPRKKCGGAWGTCWIGTTFCIAWSARSKSAPTKRADILPVWMTDCNSIHMI